MKKLWYVSLVLCISSRAMAPTEDPFDIEGKEVARPSEQPIQPVEPAKKRAPIIAPDIAPTRQAAATKEEVVKDLREKINRKLSIIFESMTAEKPEWWIVKDQITDMYLLVKRYGFGKDQTIQKAMAEGLANIKAALSQQQKSEFEKQIQQAKKTTLPQELERIVLVDNTPFNLMPSWRQEAAECGLRAINSAALLYYFCTGKLQEPQLRLDLLSRREIAFNGNELATAIQECNQATFNNLSEQQVEKIAQLLPIAQENIIIIGNYGDVKNNLYQMIPEKIIQLSQAIKGLQTKQNVSYIFLLNTAGYKTAELRPGEPPKELTVGGHWTAIVMCKKRGILEGYVADSSSLYTNGKIKESLTEQMKWVTARIKSDYKELLVNAYADLNTIRILIEQENYISALEQLEAIIQKIQQDQLYNHPAFQKVLKEGILPTIQTIAKQSVIGTEIEIDSRNATALLKAIEGLKDLFK